MAQSYRSGAAEILPGERRVLVGGKPAALGARAFDVLMALLERRERVVTKDELLDAAWPGLVVEENNLQVHVSALRKVLGRDAIATIPGRGYRFTLTLEGERAAATASPAAAAATATNLAAPSESLVGRDADVAAVAAALGSARLVTVLGPGGVGKSRLAAEAARAHLGRFPDGVWWVDLARVQDPSQVAPAIAAAARLQLGAGSATAGLALALAPRASLLVLDNCEHLVEEIAAIAASALAAAPGLVLLATSQVPLKLHGEVLHRLEPLALPPEGADAASRDYGAVQLFTRRVLALDRRFAIDDGNIALVAAICRELEGLPLAIEMAAARAPLLGLPALAARLGDRLRLLRGNHRDNAARHDTLVAALDWSYALLTPQEQGVLRRLGAFKGSFRLDAAQHLCANEALDVWEVLEVLAALVDRSLVQVDAGGARYRLLETTRLYALEKLRAAGEAGDTELRHGHAMARIAAEATQAFREEPDLECIQRYMNDYADLTQAFEAAAARRDAPTAAWTADALMRIDAYRNILSEVARRKRLVHGLLPADAPETDARLWSCITMARSIPLAGVGKLEACRADVEAWRRVGHRVQLYEALGRFASSHASAGDAAAARAALLEARALEEPAWPAPLRLAFAFNAAIVAAFGEDTAAFRRAIAEESELAEAARSWRFSGNVTLFQAEAAIRDGDWAGALALVDGLMRRGRGREHLLGYSIFATVHCQALLGLERPGAALQTALQILPHSQVNGVDGPVLDVLAVIAARASQPAEAALLLGCADRAYRRIEESRRPQDRKLAGEAEALARAVLGAAEASRLRAQGAGLTSAEASRTAAALRRDVIQEG